MQTNCWSRIYIGPKELEANEEVFKAAKQNQSEFRKTLLDDFDDEELKMYESEKYALRDYLRGDWFPHDTLECDPKEFTEEFVDKWNNGAYWIRGRPISESRIVKVFLSIGQSGPEEGVFGVAKKAEALGLPDHFDFS